VHKAAETQQMVSDQAEDLDLVGVADDELEAAIQVFHVRRGRVVGRSGSVADKVEDLSAEQFIGRVLQELYGAPGAEVPRRVLVPVLPESPEVVTAWLSSLRGGPVRLSVPRRGEKRALHETVTRNAAEDLTRHRLRRSADHNARSRALTELEEALGLSRSPLRIECFDMSHLQGTDYVGSMVVFEDGLAKKSDYRRFVVKSVPGNDDYAAMEEVLTRRLTNLLNERTEVRQRRESASDDDLSERRVAARQRFAYAPQLLVLDGGKGQLGVGERVLRTLGLSDEIEIASLAKQFEEVYRPGSPDPIRIPRGTEALYLLQRVRDEAHRFAITFHRERRGRRMTTSVLDGVPGLGPARKKRLLATFGGVRALRAATPEELAALAWLPDSVAAALCERLQGAGAGRRSG
jgi:excinuclease ABC subunit C